MTVTSPRRSGRGWNAFAAILLIFAGTMGHERALGARQAGHPGRQPLLG